MTNLKFSISNFVLTVVCGLWSIASHAQADSTYRIGLILPFQTAGTAEKLEAYSNAHDFFTASRIRLDDDAITALDFYQGMLEALAESKDSFKIELSVYDNWNSDSVTTEILKKPELKKNNIIIGSVTTSSAKLVAEYCMANKIVNVQPFTPSKTLGIGNPYHLKIAPTIDAHADAMFNSLIDSFAGANVIIYTTDAERHLVIAKRFDSLLRDYNTTAEKKFTVALLNTKNMLLNGQKTTVTEQLKSGRQNVIIITSFDESFVNGNLRVLHDKLSHDSTIVVYGLPTWLNGEVLRLDYVNDFHTRISDFYNENFAVVRPTPFTKLYADKFHTAPGRFAYLGFDVTNFLLYNLGEYGTGFPEFLATQHYTGAAYKFDIAKNMKDKETLNYYENTAVNVFMVDNYMLKRVW
ncbi:MAG TPA: hypothetical protein VK154_11690 [Chitinophagales bacterium]|nr:hypothetical protein [Chitinophagales bacterium]